MSPFFTRTLFAGASVALTAAIVAASAPAYAATLPVDAHRTTVQFRDLDLGNAAGRQTLDRRIQAAADRVCPVGDATSSFAEMRCRDAAVAQARAAVERMSSTATLASN